MENGGFERIKIVREDRAREVAFHHVFRETPEKYFNKKIYKVNGLYFKDIKKLLLKNFTLICKKQNVVRVITQEWINHFSSHYSFC